MHVLYIDFSLYHNLGKLPCQLPVYLEWSIKHILVLKDKKKAVTCLLFYELCSFNRCLITVLHNFLYFVTISNILFSPSLQVPILPSIYTNSLVNLLNLCCVKAHLYLRGDYPVFNTSIGKLILHQILFISNEIILLLYFPC